MKQILLNIKDSSKVPFLLELIKQLDFVEVEKVKKKRLASNYNFFNSAGLWAKRELDARKLRSQAWNR